ncbi:MAG: hypothetical protein ACRDS9_23760, partial [Pseudonocardiaceae bacterium]
MGWTIEQTSHRLVCDALRQAVAAGPGDDASGIDSIRYRAAAVLYTLLLDHPLDRRGRCRSCRRSGAMIGPRRRPCRIYLRASYWLLRPPDEAEALRRLADVPDGWQVSGGVPR